MSIVWGFILPFLGTALGASMVFMVRKSFSVGWEKFLMGLAGGVMLAASIWSLILPALKLSEDWGYFAWVPSALGLIMGFGLLFFVDFIVVRLSLKNKFIISKSKKTSLLVIAVVLHNIPEGMAVGVALAGAVGGNPIVTIAGALSLAIGIAIQNFPEGAIISMPLKANGFKSFNAFSLGVLSGVVEPIFAVISFYVVGIISSVLPLILTFASGAMIFVVIVELLPFSQSGEKKTLGIVGFLLGFIIMMALDVAFG